MSVDKIKGVEEIPPIKNGLVIDHIIQKNGPKVYRVLEDYIWDNTTIMRSNIKPKEGKTSRFSEKVIIKIEDVILEKEVMDKLAFISCTQAYPITINEIKEMEVVGKYHPNLPDIINGGIVQCDTSDCLSQTDRHAIENQQFQLDVNKLRYLCECGDSFIMNDVEEHKKHGLRRPVVNTISYRCNYCTIGVPHKDIFESL